MRISKEIMMFGSETRRCRVYSRHGACKRKNEFRFSLDMPKDGSKGINLQCVSSSTGNIVIINHDRIKILNIRQRDAKVGQGEKTTCI